MLRAFPRSTGRRPSIDSYKRLAEVFHDVLSEESLGSLLDRVADTLADLVPYDTLTIWRADEARQLLVPVLARDTWADAIMRTTIPFGAGVTGAAVTERRPLHSRQVQLDPRASIVPGTPSEPEALVSVPLIARGRVKGALNVYRLGDEEVASFSDDEVELAGRFGDAVALALDNAEIRAALEHQAQTDSLTGLYNHRQFHERLRAELARARRSGDPTAVVMVDVDDFKRVNDVHGHAAGDHVLVQIAGLLETVVRESDVVCRLGGEEFVVLLPDCDAGSARALAERLRTLLARTAFDPVGTISVSAGIAEAPAHARSAREVACCAEAAMMTAKSLETGSVVVFGEQDGSRPRELAFGDRDARSIAHLKMLQSLVGKLNRLNDVARIGETIVDELRSLVDYHSGRVYVRDGDELVPIAHRGDLGVDEPEVAEALACRVGEGITGRVAETGQARLVANALECADAIQIPGTPESEESLLAVPLCYSSRVVGVIVVSMLGVDQFDEDDLRLLEVLAGHASVALENARLYEAERREAAHARESAGVASALLELSRELAAAESLEDVLLRVATSSARVLAAPRVSVWIQHEPGEPLGLGAELGHETGILLAASRIDPTRVQRLLQGDRPALVDRAAIARLSRVLGASSGSYALAPLRLDGGRIGLIAVAWPDDSTSPSTRRALRLLAGIADQATLAIGNAGNVESLERTFLTTAEALANAVGAGHGAESPDARSLTDLALRVGRELELDGPALKRLELAALFHDVGKLAVPPGILTKPGPLTPSERAAVELHPALGERILAPVERLAEVRPIVRHCHEHFDGSGYPDGLAGEEIPIESRIVFVCDSFHAMTADRPYRRRLPRREALRRLKRAAGSQFDAEIVAVVLRLLTPRGSATGPAKRYATLTPRRRR